MSTLDPLLEVYNLPKSDFPLKTFKYNNLDFNLWELDWKNILFYGDNRTALKILLQNGWKGKVDLIYLDPPFFTRTNYCYQSYERIQPNHFKSDNENAEKFIPLMAFADFKNKDLAAYLRFMHERLLSLRELLSDTGTLYIHLDWHVVHYIKLIMDDLFGYKNFRNEIVWRYKSSAPPKKDFQRNHDIILRYSKTKEYTFNTQYEPYSPSTLKRFDQEDEKGRRYKIVTKRDQQFIVYQDNRGKQMDDVWEQQIIVGGAKEYLGYPTQKPESLIKRIILASSNEGDIVADFFSGSGTFLSCAQQLHRKWIGCDSSAIAIPITKKRILEIDNSPFMMINLKEAAIQLGEINTAKKSKISLTKKDIQFISEDKLIWIYRSKDVLSLHVFKSFIEDMKRKGLTKGIVLANNYDFAVFTFASSLSKLNVQLRSIQGIENLESLLNKTKNKINFNQFPLSLGLDFDYIVNGLKTYLKLKSVLYCNSISKEAKNIKNSTEMIKFWEVDWDYHGKIFNSYPLYAPNRIPPSFQTEHTYGKKGKYIIFIKVYDIYHYQHKRLIHIHIK